jgi:hypothetical protein
MLADPTWVSRRARATAAEQGCSAVGWACARGAARPVMVTRPMQVLKRPRASWYHLATDDARGVGLAQRPSGGSGAGREPAGPLEAGECGLQMIAKVVGGSMAAEQIGRTHPDEHRRDAPVRPRGESGDREIRQ